MQETKRVDTDLKVGDTLLYDASVHNFRTTPTYYKVYIEKVMIDRDAVLISSGKWVTIAGAEHYRNLFLNIEKKYLKYIIREYFTNESNFLIPIPNKLYAY